MEKVVGFFRLMRPANIVTAVADILAGMAISGFFLHTAEDVSPVVWLILSTIGLYGGGIVMNDVFDAELDAVERPERPIPSGLISRTEASVLGLLLLAAGVSLALLVSTFSGLLALAIAVCALLYDKWAKHHPFLGPLNMGICRGLNLLLGISIIPEEVTSHSLLAFVPIAYIAAITLISRGEVHGGKRITIYTASFLYVCAMAAILFVSFRQGHLLVTTMFVALWAIMVFLPLQKALARPEGKMIGRAVKAGVLALIIMNGAWAAAFGVTYLAFIIILLLPLSILLARVFAVT